MITTPVIQFGTSRFLQAHADFFISQAMQSGQALGPVTVVKTSGAAERDRRLAGLRSEQGFPVQVCGLVDGKVVDETVKVTSVKRALSAVNDWSEVNRIFADEAKVVISNTADRGYDLDPSEPALPAGMPNSFPGKLVVLLHERFKRKGTPLTILPTELVSRNGSTLAAIVNQLAQDWYGEADFSAWIDTKVIFANSLVDRIVSKALEPAGAVCEPYALWAIEATEGLVLPCRHPAIVLTPDISNYEHLKLFILNLGHTALVQYWLEHAGAERLTVREIVDNPEARNWLETLLATEVVPGFAAKGLGDQADAYAKTTLERFSNPFLDHYLADIWLNHAEKIRRRIGGFLQWSGIENAPQLQKILNSAT